MYSSVMKTLNATDGRYPTVDEEESAIAWASSLPKRLQAANLISQKESEIVREAIDMMKPMFPRFGAQHDRAYDKGTRDLQLCLRYAVQGMIADDADMPQEKLFVWYGTIIRSLGLTPHFTRESCQAVFNATRRNLPPDAFELAQPYLQRMVDDVSSFPEPMKPAVN